MGIKLQTHPDGNIITCPITGWEMRTAGDTALLVVIEYIDLPEQLETGERKQLQTIVTPHEALEFADSLQKYARLILTPKSGKPVN